MNTHKNDLPDYSKEVLNNFAGSAFARKLGIRLTAVAAGSATAELTISPDLLNIFGMAHGGAIFTLADVAFASAANTRGPTVAMQVSINFIHAAKLNSLLRATAVEERVTRKTGIYSITVEDEQGEVIALFRGIVYRKT
jgi:acyl-CoA thioesterase